MAKKKLTNQEIIEAFFDGKSMVKLAKEKGMSQGNVYRRAKKVLPPNTFKNRKEWVKLNKVKTKKYKTATRTICISRKILEQTGFNPDDELVGKWIVVNGELKLMLRKDDE